MNDPIRDKQALKAAIEVTTSTVGTFSATIDSESRSNSVALNVGYLSWVNSSGTTITWTNNSSTVINWYNPGYLLYKADAQQYGKYLGLTITASDALFTLNTLELEYELRARF
jgi:hypothetical protein